MIKGSREAVLRLLTASWWPMPSAFLMVSMVMVV